MKNIEMCLTD